MTYLLSWAPDLCDPRPPALWFVNSDLKALVCVSGAGGSPSPAPSPSQMVVACGPESGPGASAFCSSFPREEVNLGHRLFERSRNRRPLCSVKDERSRGLTVPRSPVPLCSRARLPLTSSRVGRRRFPRLAGGSFSYTGAQGGGKGEINAKLYFLTEWKSRNDCELPARVLVGFRRSGSPWELRVDSRHPDSSV